MKLKQLSQQEIEKSPEQYAMYLAYGDPDVTELEEEMDCYIKQHKEFDLNTKCPKPLRF